MAITIDDLPYVTGYASRPMSRSDAHAATISNIRLLDVLAKHHVPVTGFVIEKSLESIGRPVGRGILRDWIDEGFDLGNHSYAHLDFNKLTAAEMEDQILRGEATIAPLMHDAGRQLQFFRFPFNHTGDTLAKHETLAAFLAQHKYRLAPCTIENEDWMFAESFFRMRAHYKDADARRLIDDYLKFTGAQIDYFAALNKQIFGYEPPEILLIHDNALNAETMDRLLGLFEARGYQFVSLTEAESDPAYSTPESFVTSYGPMWGYRWAKVKGIPVDGRKEPDPPGWIVHYEVPRTTPLHHKG
ncbi:MAG TPA: polysaccharide deacetylase family protein [Acidobacteriaceae bacterium]|nr:polysaccharide deacetylase family protein [Acidobacteriaceae bacterium]